MDVHRYQHVLHVAIHRLNQFREKSVRVLEPYFKISLEGEKSTQQKTSIGQRGGQSDEFRWDEEFQFPFDSNRPPTELVLCIKRKRLMTKSRIIASTSVPLYRLRYLAQYTGSQNLLDSENLIRGSVNLTVWISSSAMNTSHLGSLHKAPEWISSSLATNGLMPVPLNGQQHNLELTWSSSHSGQTWMSTDSEIIQQTRQPCRQLTETMRVYGQAEGLRIVPNLASLTQNPAHIKQDDRIRPRHTIQERKHTSEPCTRYPRIVDDGSFYHECF